MPDPTPLATLDYAPPPRSTRLRRWLLQGGLIALVLLVAAGLIWRDEVRGAWNDGWGRYHTWRAERALERVLAQDHNPPIGTIVRDGGAMEPVRQAKPKALADWQRHSAAAIDLQPPATPAGEAIVLAGPFPGDPASPRDAATYLLTATASDSGLRFDVERPDGPQPGQPAIVRGPTTIAISDADGRDLDFALGRIDEEDPRRFSIPYAFNGQPGQIAGTLAPIGDWQNAGWRSLPILVRPVATHGWISLSAERFGRNANGRWFPGDGKTRRGLEVEWERVSEGAAGAVAFAPDGRLLVWAKLRVFKVHPRSSKVIASVEPPDLYADRDKAVADDPSDKWRTLSNVVGDSRLVKYHDAQPDGTFAFLRLDGYVFRVTPDGEIDRLDLVPDVRAEVLCEEHPYWYGKKEAVTEHRAIRLAWHYTRPYEHPHGSGIALAGDGLVVWDSNPQRIGWLNEGEFEWQEVAGPSRIARAFAGGPDGAVILIASSEPATPVREVEMDDGEVLEVPEPYEINALNAAPVLYRPGRKPRIIGPGNPAAAAAFSPDGTLLALADERDGRHGMTVVEVETGGVLLEAHALPEPIAHAPPAWSLDGRRVAFSGEHHLYVADLPSGVAYQLFKPVIKANGYERVPEWQGHQVALSPDGGQLAYLSNRHGTFIADLPPTEHPPPETE